MMPGGHQMLPETTRCAGRLPDVARSCQTLRGAHQMLQEGVRRWIFIDLHRFSSILETPGPECRAGLWQPVAACGGLWRAAVGPLIKIVLQIWCARKLQTDRQTDRQTAGLADWKVRRLSEEAWLADWKVIPHARCSGRSADLANERPQPVGVVSWHPTQCSSLPVWHAHVYMCIYIYIYIYLFFHVRHIFIYIYIYIYISICVCTTITWSCWYSPAIFIGRGSYSVAWWPLTHTVLPRYQTQSVQWN